MLAVKTWTSRGSEPLIYFLHFLSEQPLLITPRYVWCWRNVSLIIFGQPHQELLQRIIYNVKDKRVPITDSSQTAHESWLYVTSHQVVNICQPTFETGKLWHCQPAHMKGRMETFRVGSRISHSLNEMANKMHNYDALSLATAQRAF